MKLSKLIIRAKLNKLTEEQKETFNLTIAETPAKLIRHIYGGDFDKEMYLLIDGRIAIVNIKTEDIIVFSYDEICYLKHIINDIAQI